MKKNGIKQIAEIAGCSYATVSRVLNNRPGISDPVRKKILNIATKLDYTNSRKKRIIAVLAYLDTDGFDHYSMHLLRQMVNGLHRAGFHVEVLFNEDYKILGEHYVSGIVSIKMYNNTASSIGSKLKLPMISVNDFDNLPEDIHMVYSDNQQAIEESVDYLVQCGHRSIYLLTPVYEDNFSTANRIRSFREYIEKLDLSEHCGIVFSRNNFLATIPVDEYVKALPSECTALISTIEVCAVRLHTALQKLRPDVTLVTWALPWQDEVKELDIPCMQQDFDSLVEKTIQLLIDKLDGKKISNQAIPYIFNRRG